MAKESRAALRDSLVCVDGIAQIIDQAKVDMDPGPGRHGRVDLARVSFTETPTRPRIYQTDQLRVAGRRR